MTGFRCHTCGRWHDELPLDVGFDDPLYIHELTDDERAGQVTSAGDLLVRNGDQGMHHVVRGVIEIPVRDSTEVFCFGVWTTLNAESYEQAGAAYRANEAAGPFFGWLGNRLTVYPDTLGLQTNVNVRPNLKPSIVLHSSPHPLHVEQRDGITMDGVRQIIEAVLHPETERDARGDNGTGED
jgi:hypothetical protein